MKEEHQNTGHDGEDGGDQWGSGQKILAKKTEKDTAVERPGSMLRRERGDSRIEKSWGLEQGQPGQQGEAQESCTRGTSTKRIG